MTLDTTTVLALIGLAVAVSQATNTYFSFQAAAAGRDAAKINKETQVIATATRVAAEQTEKNTNSMKDALVAATKQAAHAAGFVEAEAAGKVKAAELLVTDKEAVEAHAAGVIEGQALSAHA